MEVALVSALLAAPAGAAPRASTLPPRSIVLSDGWLIQPDPPGVGDAKGWWKPEFERRGWRPVTVPMAWDFYDPVMDGYEGIGWYALRLPADRVARAAWQRLRFGRANHRARVWIDGHEAGENLTGYLPFEISATPWLTAGSPAWASVWWKSKITPRMGCAGGTEGTPGP